MMSSNKNISKYYLYQFLNNLMFFSPIIVLFWQSKGLTMTQIMLLQSIYAIGVSVLELPTGAFADYFGKKSSLILGALLFALGSFWYSTSSYFWQFVIAELICGTGSAFVSGADRAFIHQTLRSDNRENDFRKIEGKARGISQIAQAFANIFGGLIGAISLNLTLVASGFSALAAFFIGLTFSKTKIELPRDEQTNFLQIIKEGILLIKNQPALFWLTLFFAFFNGIVWINVWFSQPYLKLLNVPIVYFGPIFAIFALVCALGSALTHRFEKITKDKSFLVLGLVSAAIMLLLANFPNIYVFFLWSLLNTFIFMNQTLITDKVLKIIPHSKAATVLSFQSLCRRILYAFLAPILGIVADKAGIRMAIQTQGLILLFFLLILFAYKKQTHLKI